MEEEEFFINTKKRIDEIIKNNSSLLLNNGPVEDKELLAIIHNSIVNGSHQSLQYLVQLFGKEIFLKDKQFEQFENALFYFFTYLNFKLKEKKECFVKNFHML